jgi:superfamily II DNA or RNA helicase
MNQPIAKLIILDSIHTKANEHARRLILPALEYEKTTYRRGRFGGKNITTKQYAITGRKGTAGTFLTGLIPRIVKYAKENNIELKIDSDNQEIIEPSRNIPKLKGIVFRPDQKKALRAIKKHQRGIVKFPTGTGKTIIALGAFSMFENSPRLFLCHTKDLLLQTTEEIKLLPSKTDLFTLGGGYKPAFREIRKCKAPIVVSTIQTFSKYKPSEWADFFDFTIVDEVHNASKRKSRYGRMMEFNLSPIKIGLSATPPKNGIDLLTCEGFFGPIISDLSMEVGIKKGIIAKPKINLVPVPEEPKIKEAAGRSFQKIYEYGIVTNKTRNRLIVNLVKKSIKKNEISLVIVERTNHAEVLQKMMEAEKIISPIVQGSSSRENRKKIKDKLKNKKLNVAICTKVWREGVNIPVLNHIINAHGMKSEKIIIQAMGRGLRTAAGKDSIKLSDFLDPYQHLSGHSIQRVQIYIQQGWM